MSPKERHSAPGEAATLAPELSDPGLARDRTRLAWTRSALNIAGSGTLIARASFAAHLDALGVASAIAMAAIALLTWRHGQAMYRDRSHVGTFTDRQPGALGLLTAATLVIAAVAIVVTILWSG